MKIEEQVQQLTAKLSQTELEKQSLAAKNRVLEAALNSARATTTQVSLHCSTMTLSVNPQ